MALYRPGPLGSGMVDDYVNRKHGRTRVEYLVPELEELTAGTLGVIVYQDQVLQIANRLAGYSLARGGPAAAGHGQEEARGDGSSAGALRRRALEERDIDPRPRPRRSSA